MPPPSTASGSAIVCSLTDWLPIHERPGSAPAAEDFVSLADLHFQSVFDDGLYDNEELVPRDLLRAYFRTQHRLDGIYDEGNGWAYLRARNSLYPECDSGSRKNQLNRASDKLIQLDDAVPFVGASPSVSSASAQPDSSSPDLLFADLCSAPGGWSYTLLDRFPGARGVAMSLSPGDGMAGLTWDPRLDRFISSGRLKTTLGVDGTGSVYNPDNVSLLAQLQAAAKELPGPYNLFLADGGFLLEGPGGERHVEHLQESIVAKLLYSEVVAGLRLLGRSGNMVIKMFGSCTVLTSHLLYLLLTCFRELHVVKPGRSRIVNEEKYLVARGYRGLPQGVLDHLVAVLRDWNRRDADGGPWSLRGLLKPNGSAGYTRYLAKLRELNTRIISVSNSALAAVIDRAEHILRDSSTRSRSVARRKIKS